MFFVCFFVHNRVHQHSKQEQKMTNTQALIEKAHKRAIKRMNLDIKHFSCFVDTNYIVSKVRNSNTTITSLRLWSGKYIHFTHEV